MYDYINFFDNRNKKIRELYNKDSYILDDSRSLLNIKEKFLNKFNLVQPEHPLIRRYAKFLHDNYKERFPKSKFLIKLQQEYQLNIDDLSDYDYEEFNE